MKVTIDLSDTDVLLIKSYINGDNNADYFALEDMVVNQVISQVYEEKIYE